MHLKLILVALTPLLSAYTSPVKTADKMLGIPYREDGAQNLKGEYITFENQEKTFTSPGFNCSGFLVSVSRKLLNPHLNLTQASMDRKHDSGPDSPMGEDWDFGLDLIFNIAKGFKTKAVGPERPKLQAQTPETMYKQKGFNLHNLQLWQQTLSKIKSGAIYLSTVSKPYRKKGYKLIYYHVGMIIRESHDKVWFYHSTRKSGVHKLNLKSQSGMELMQKEFARSPYGDKYIYLLEVGLPDNHQKS